jgi:hypothetical protein
LFPYHDLGYIYGKKPEHGTLDYTPKWEVGARMPHLEVAVGEDGTRMSTVDVIAMGPASFTVLYKEEALLEEINSQIRNDVPRTLVLVVGRDRDEQVSHLSAADLVIPDLDGKWPDDVSGVVVRPDGHILSVLCSGQKPDVAEVGRTLERYLSGPRP